MFRYQARRGRLGALGVMVVAAALAWVPPASAAPQPSHAIGVVPGPILMNDPADAPCGKFKPPDYGVNAPGETLPALEVDWFETVPGVCSSTGYTWDGIGHVDASAPSVVGIDAAALAGVDTLVLYGVRWDSIDPAGRAAIVAFARNHKVMIWDSDSTTAKPDANGNPDGQDYGSYLVPFRTFASGGQKTNSPFPVQITDGDILNQPSAIDRTALANEPHAIGDMTVMVPADPSVWHASIKAQNDTLNRAPGGAPGDTVVAWALGDQAAQTGMTIYSGIDADALDFEFGDLGRRNEARTEFENQLAAPFCVTACPTTPQSGTHVVTIFTLGGGGGTVTASPPGSDCGALCYHDGTAVTLVESASSDSVFAGWAGACSGLAPTCSVTVSRSDLSVSATFTRPAALPHALRVTKSGDGDGHVTSSPLGIDCGLACSSTFLTGSAVTLSATPAPGSVFLGWSGACLGVGGCSVTLDADRDVSAVFSTEQRRCSITPRTAWVHGVIALKGTTNVPGASGLRAMTAAGKQVGLASRVPPSFSVNVDTRKLPTNRTASIRVQVLAGTTVLCSASTNLRVDNTKPRAIGLKHHRSGRFVLLSFRPSEANVKVKAYGRGKKPTIVKLKTTKRTTVGVLAGAKRARLQLIDRAGNLRTVYVALKH